MTADAIYILSAGFLTLIVSVLGSIKYTSKTHNKMCERIDSELKDYVREEVFRNQNKHIEQALLRIERQMTSVEKDLKVLIKIRDSE